MGREQTIRHDNVDFNLPTMRMETPEENNLNSSLITVNHLG
jgi:hypothetical protein